MNCAEILNSIIAAECNQKATAGLENDILLINYNDIDRDTSVVANGVISSLVLKLVDPSANSQVRKNAYSFTSFGKSYNETGVTLNVGTYMNTWTHSVSLRIFNKDQEIKDFVNKLGAGARLVVIVKNKEFGKNGDVRYEVYGWENGLTIAEGTGVVEMTDGLVYGLKVASEEGAQEPDVQKSVFATGGITATESMINGLTAKA